MAETYYERLDVATDASVEAIERAYRQRLKETHPDVSDHPRAAERTRELIEARRVLTDEHERAVYDRIGHAAYTATDADAGDPGSTSTTESSPSTPGATTASTGTSSDRGDSATANASTANGGRATTGTTDRERRRRQNRETRAAWNTTGGVANGGVVDGGVYAHEWRAWDTNSAYRIHPTDASGLGSRLFPVGPSIVMLLVAFGLYPVLLWGSLEPAFPLVFNLLMGVCLLALVGFLASMPPVGMTVFGTWLLFLPGLLGLAGVPFGSPPWIAVLLGTGTPLVLSAVIWAALRA